MSEEIEIYKKIVNYKDIKFVQVKVIKTVLQKNKKYNNLAKNYEDYLKKLQAEKNPNDYIKTVAIKMFFNKEVKNHEKSDEEVE
ncbi:8345_t:CDS:2 [Cetraspora pellucida]|uniref:8345_t:CDS:1 n=1 Tax=Cetraspora pellucida TaxID=1433469 RepID=A0A9N9EGP9_9GLOM|nr:8345_t:CDS:2 [Cetraspora pellucida]